MPSPCRVTPIACTPSAPILATQLPAPARISASSLRPVPETIAGCAIIASRSTVSARRALAAGVKWALIISTLFGFAAFACFWLARRTIREDTVS